MRPIEQRLQYSIDHDQFNQSDVMRRICIDDVREAVSVIKLLRNDVMYLSHKSHRLEKMINDIIAIAEQLPMTEDQQKTINQLKLSLNNSASL
jgi:hypothetical protein